MMKPDMRSVSEPKARPLSPRRRRLRYIAMKLRYDSLAQLALDGLAVLGIRIEPYRLYLEGLALLPDDAQQASVGRDDFKVRPLRREDLAFIASLPDRDHSEKSLKRRLEAGMIGLGAWRGDDLAAFVWCDLKACDYSFHAFALNSDEAYLCDTYTLPRFRGGGLAPHMRRLLYTEMARMGRTTLYSISDTFNTPSIRFKRKLNARLLDAGVGATLFGRWRFCRRRTGYRLGS